jgi:hypothetical protein
MGKPGEDRASIWTIIAGMLLCVTIVAFLLSFYRQQAATKYVMVDVPTGVVVVEIENTQTRTITPTRTPTAKPSITPTQQPVYGQASPQPVMVVPKWTPTSFPTSVVDENELIPCITVTPSKYEDILCAGEKVET